MMNRIALESFANSGRRASVGSHIRGGGKVTAGGDGDDALDLFSRTRRSDGDQIRLDKISVGPGRIGRGMEDLLDSEIGKHDYDWLLTPPETPLYPSAVARESPLSSTTVSREGLLSSTGPPATTRESTLTLSGPRGRATARSVSNTRPSRLSTSQTDNSHLARPVRSSSVTRPSISSSYSNSSFSSNNNRTSMLNTSSASITSSRPSTPSRSSRPSFNSTTNTRPTSSSTSIRPSSSSNISRPSSSSTISRTSSNASSNARSSSTTRPVNSRLPTPTRSRPNPSTTSTVRTASNSRPSTPNSSRPQTPSNPNPNISSRVNSRPSTPTRRPASSAGPSASTGTSRIPSINRVPSANSRNPVGPGSRPSSPGPRARAPVRPIDLPDFPTDAPPNLRTKLPERPASAGRTRPGMALTLRSNANSDASVPAGASTASNRRNYTLPVVSRGRFPENPPKGVSAKVHGSNGHEIALDGGLRRKPASATESTGFGRNISKKSLDMALRHMDIRQGMGGLRASSLFPQSIRSASTKTKLTRKSDPIVPLSHDESMPENHSFNGTISPDCRSSIAFSENGDFAVGSTKSPDRESLATRESELDLLHGSTRYDAFMLKEEDSKNMNWLHSVEDKSDQSPVFDHRFEPLPEPFGLL